MDASLADIKSQLREFVRRELMAGAEIEIGDDDPLITGGFVDSFSLALVGVFIEETFGVYIPDPELTVENMDTIALMAARIALECRANGGV